MPTSRLLRIAASVLLCCASVWFAVAQCPADVAADEPPDASAKTVDDSQRLRQPLRFVRVFALAEEPQKWPRGPERYIPMQADRFERLLERAREPAGRFSAPPASVSAAVYHARLEKGGVLRGTARLHIDLHGKSPVLMPLEPCGLVFSKAKWEFQADGTAVEEGSVASPLPAVLGSDEQGHVGLLVQRCGTLAVTWMLRGGQSLQNGVDAKRSVERDRFSDTAMAFDLTLPACPSNVMILDLPPGLVPQVEWAIVSADAEPPQSTTARPRRWRVELGGRNRCKLRLTSSNKPSTRQAVAAQQSLLYEISEQGVEVSSTVRLEVAPASIISVNMLVGRSLQVIQAQCGDQPATWSVSPGTDGKYNRVTLQLPVSVRGEGLDVQLRAYCPVVTDRAWRLPRIRPQSVVGGIAREETNIFWQQGVATLVVADPLKIIDLKKIDCRQLKTGRLRPPISGESVQLQMFSHQATAELVLSPSISSPKVDCGVAVDLDASGINAKVTANFSSKRHRHFRLEADLASQWIIDSLRSLPDNAIEDWEVQHDADGSRRLVVRLSEPLSAARGPLRLLVSLHNPRSALHRELSLKALLPLNFSACHAGKTLLAIHALKPHQLKFHGDVGVSLRDADAMPEDDLRLFTQLPKGLVISPRESVEALRVSLQRQHPSYDAKISVEASASENSLSEAYRISCVPRNAQVERLLICLSAARGSALCWRLNSQDNRQLATRRLTAAEAAAAGLGREGETWELTLPHPFDTAFEITASRNSRITEKMSLSLAVLPEAAKQSGELVVKSPDSSTVRFENHRLEPMLPQAEPTDRYAAIRAAYRYDPRGLLSSSAGAMISVLPKPIARAGDEAAVELASSAWVWSSCLESQFQTDGTACHWAYYRIENAGRGWLKLELPADIDMGNILGVWINDQATTWQTESKADHRAELCHEAADREAKACRPPCGSSADGTVKEISDFAPSACDARPKSLRIGLPYGLRFVVVRVNFNTVAAPLGIRASLRPPLPVPDIPTLRRRWTVWLPPGYASLAGEYESAVEHAAAFASPSTAERVFGPLGRPLHEKRFDPLSADAWQNVVRWFASEDDTRQTTMLLERIGRISLHNPAAVAVFNSELLNIAQRPVLLDAEALACAGLTPTTALISIDGDRLRSQVGQAHSWVLSDQQAADRGVRLLRDWGLALLSHERAFVLTTLRQAAVFAEHLQPVGGGVVWQVKVGALHDWISAATGSPHNNSNLEQSKLMSPSAWAALPDGPQTPWAEFASTQLLATDMPGWTATRVEISGRETVCLPIIHRRTISLFRLSAFIVALAAGWWKGRNRPLQVATVAAAFAIAALLAPLVVAAICSSVVLGLLFCLLGRLICLKVLPKALESAAGEQNSAASVATATYIIAGVVLVMMFLSWQTVAAAEIDADATAFESNAVATEFVPEPSSVGTRKILRDAGSRSAAVRHEIPVAETAEVPNIKNQLSPVQAEDMAGVYRVFVPVDKHQQSVGNRVFVPAVLYERLERRFAAAAGRPHGWLLTSAVYQGAIRLHGRLQRPVVEDLHVIFQIMLFDPEAEVRLCFDKNDVSFTTAACRLDGRSVRLRWSDDGRSIVVPVRQAGRHRLELTLQPLEKPNLLDLAIPRLLASRLELVLPVGETSLEAPASGGAVKFENGTFVADFGGCDRLFVRSSGSTVRSLTPPSVESEELLWLKIRPGSVVVEAKFLLKVNAGEVSELLLEADPRLRLLEHGDLAEIVEVPGNPRLRLIRLSAPCCDHTVVTARFLLREGSGVGHFRPPRLRLLLTPALSMGLLSDENPAKPPATDAFVAAQGGLAASASVNVAASTQRLAVSIDPGLDFSHQGRPPSALRSVGEFLDSWGQSSERPQFVCSAEQIDPQWSIATRPRRPPLEVAQWLRVTFDTKKIHFRLRAELIDTPGRGFQYKIAAPRSLVVENVSVVEEGAQRVSRWTRCADGAVNVFLNGPAAVARTLSLDGHMTRPPQGKFRVPLFRLNNSKQTSCRIALFGEPSLLVSIDKQAGLIESDWPPADKSSGVHAAEQETLAGAALRKQPDADSDAAAGDRPRLVKAFIADGTQEMDLHVSLSTNPAATARVAAPTPDVAVGDSSARDRSIAGGSPDSGSCESVLDASPENGLGECEVLLADMNVVWHSDGTCSGTASFDLLPNGCRRCPLRLPENLQLIKVRLDGIATVVELAHVSGAETAAAQTVKKSKYREYRLQLASRRLPQRIEVIFKGCLPRGRWRGLQNFEPPRLGDLEIAKTLWRVTSPRQFAPSRTASSADRLEQAMIRLENIAAIIAKTVAAPAVAPDELRNWYRPWAVRYACVCRNAQRALAMVNKPQLVRSTLARIEQLDTRGLAIAHDLAAEAMLRDYLAEPPATADAQDLVQTGFNSSAHIGIASLDATDGENSAGELSFRRTGTASFYGRIGTALGILLFMGLVHWGSKRGLPLASAWRWPHLFGVAAGLVWWLLLTPGLLGIVIAVLCLAAGVWRGEWRKKRRSDYPF